MLEKVRGLCFPCGQEGAGRAAAGAVSSPEAARRRGKMVSCNVTIPVQPSGPALSWVDAGLALALESRDPAWFPLVDGSVGLWVPGWFLWWWRGLFRLFG